MRVLVTGAGGFVGRHLLGSLADQGHEPLPVEAPGHADPGMAEADVRQADDLAALVQRLRPEACVHLAAMAYVPQAWERPGPTFEVNVVGTMNLLTALRRHAPACRTLVISSAQVYGAHGLDALVTEDHPPAPGDMYAISKLAADLAALSFGHRHDLPIMTARPVNHIGPGQAPQYVTAAFAGQLVRIARGEAEPVVRVGNLESRRSFLDVRDVVRAYGLLLERGRPGQPYNIAAPPLHRIGEVLEILCELAGVRPRIERDPALYRPTDSTLKLDAARLREDTGWAPAYTLRDTLRDVLGEAG
jgi:GDP-4-dehydro-6-deoxy-D-mannose reductase